MKRPTPNKGRGRAANSALQRYIRRALELGAQEVKIASAASVKTAAWVRLKCQFGCGGYGERLTCPPHSPTPRETAEALACYKRCLLVHGGEWTDIQTIVSTLERELFLDGYYRAFGLGSGPCNKCSSCPPSGCRHPDEARPSMEACGIDVFATVRANGFPIEVLRNRECRGNYYGLVLID